jgi:hypothetical protein
MLNEVADCSFSAGVALDVPKKMFGCTGLGVGCFLFVSQRCVGI